MANVVKFYRGPLSAYVNATGTVTAPAVVAYKAEYEDVVFFATDKSIIYVNGIAYGSYSKEQLAAAYSKAEYTAPTADAPGKITLTPVDGSAKELTLFSIKSASNAISVETSDNTYNVKLDIDPTDKILSQVNVEASEGVTAHKGLRADFDIKYDEPAKKIYLTDKTGAQFGTAIDATAFIKDGMLTSVTLVEPTTDKPLVIGEKSYTDGQFLHLVWNTVEHKIGEDGSYIKDTFDGQQDDTYINVSSLIDIYTAGTGLATNAVESTETSKGHVEFYVKHNETDPYLTVDAQGVNSNQAGINKAISDASNLALSTAKAYTDEQIKNVNIDNVTEYKNIENALGLTPKPDGTGNGGTFQSSVYDGTSYAQEYGGKKADSVPAVIKNLDSAIKDHEDKFNSLDASLSGEGNILKVDTFKQTDGLVSGEKMWAGDSSFGANYASAAETATGFTYNATFTKDTTICDAAAELDSRTVWHDVTI